MRFEDFLKIIGIQGKEPTPKEKSRIDYEVKLSEVRRLLMPVERLPGTEGVVKAVRQRIEDAVGLAASGEHDKARLALGASQNELAQAQKTGNEALALNTRQGVGKQKEHLAQTRLKEPYLAQLTLARQALLALQDLPGADSAWRELTNTVQQAEKLAGGGDYKKAREALANVDKLLKSGKEANVQCISDAAKQFPDAVKKQLKLRQQMTAGTTLHPDAAARLLDRLNAAAAPLYAGRATRQIGAQALLDIDAVGLDVDTALQQADIAAQQATEAVEQCRTDLAKLPPQATPADRAELANRLLRLQAGVEQREFDQVIGAEAAFLADVDTLALRIVEAEKAWTTRSGELGAMADDCGRWAGAPGPMLRSAEPTPAQLAARIEALQDAEVGVHLSFDQAVITLQGIAADHQRLAQREAAQAQQTRAIEAGQLKVDAAALTARQARDALCQRANDVLRRREQPLMDGSADEARIAACLQRWQRMKDQALTPAELDDAAIVGELKQLTGAMNGVTGDAYHGASGKDQAVAARRAYADKRVVCVDVMALLEQFDSPRLTELQAVLKRFDDRMADPGKLPAAEIEQLTDSLQALTLEARVAAGAATDMTATLQRECRELVEAIDLRLDEFDQLLSRYDQSFLTKSPEYTDYQKLLKQQSADLSGLITERDHDVLTDAKRELMALQLRVEQAHQGLKGQSLPKDAPTLDRVTEKIKVARAALKNDTLTQYLGLTSAAMKKRLDDVDGNKTGRPIDDTLALLVGWQGDLDAALRKAGQARGDCKAFEDECDGLKKALAEKKGEFVSQATYHDDLVARLAKCRADGKPENQLADAKLGLKALSDEIDKAVADPAAMKEGQAQVLAVDALKETEEASWKGLYAAFTDTTLAQLKGVAPAALYKEVVALGRSAEQTFKKTADLELAEQQLRVASDRARDVIAYPDGKALHFRKQLPAAETQWKQAVQAYQEQLQSLVSAVTDADATAAGAMRDAAQSVKDAFQAGAFQGCVAAMNAEGAGAAELRHAREAGLAIVRACRAELQTNRRLVALRKNPFVDPFNSLMKLNNALFGLERNLLIGA